MLNQYKYSNEMMFHIKLCILFIIIPVLLTGCLAGYGKFRHSREVNRIFESHQVLADHKYYYSTSEAKPDAIIGIHRDYTFDSSLWWEIDLTSKQLKSWVKSMSTRYSRGFPDISYGYYILDPEGNKIGIFYTPWNPGWVKMLGDKRVSVTLPEVEDEPGDEREKELRF